MRWRRRLGTGVPSRLVQVRQVGGAPPVVVGQHPIAGRLAGRETLQHVVNRLGKFRPAALEQGLQPPVAIQDNHRRQLLNHEQITADRGAITQQRHPNAQLSQLTSQLFGRDFVRLYGDGGEAALARPPRPRLFDQSQSRLGSRMALVPDENAGPP